VRRWLKTEDVSDKNGPMPIFQAMSRDSCAGKNQTASLFAGLQKFAALRAVFENITVYDCRYEGLIKVNGEIPTFLRLQLAKFSGDTGYSTAVLMRFAGHADACNVVYITDNEHTTHRTPCDGISNKFVYLLCLLQPSTLHEPAIAGAHK
jgi:hypothetical protein